MAASLPAPSIPFAPTCAIRADASPPRQISGTPSHGFSGGDHAASWATVDPPTGYRQTGNEPINSSVPSQSPRKKSSDPTPEKPLREPQCPAVSDTNHLPLPWNAVSTITGPGTIVAGDTRPAPAGVRTDSWGLFARPRCWRRLHTRREKEMSHSLAVLYKRIGGMCAFLSANSPITTRKIAKKPQFILKLRKQVETF